VGGDEGFEPERAERAAVVGDDGDQRLHGPVRVARGEAQQGSACEHLGFLDGEFDRGYRVVLVCGGRDVPAELLLRPVVPAEAVSNSEKSSCQTWFGPVGSVAKAALRRAASCQRSRG
jgi:hypothetical protein